MKATTIIRFMWLFTAIVIIYGILSFNYDIVMFGCFWLAPFVSVMDYDYRLKWEIERKRQYEREQKRLAREKRMHRSAYHGGRH